MLVELVHSIFIGTAMGVKSIIGHILTIVNFVIDQEKSRRLYIRASW